MIIVNAAREYTWRRLRQLQSLFVLLLLGFLPVGSLLLERNESGLFLFAAIYGGVVLFVQHYMVNWKCPHCDRPFLRKKGTGPALIFRARCGNCGIGFGENAKKQ